MVLEEAVVAAHIPSPGDLAEAVVVVLMALSWRMLSPASDYQKLAIHRNASHPLSLSGLPWTDSFQLEFARF